MRVAALILPPITLKERYNKAIAYVAGSLPPLGIISLSIATVLKNSGHEVIVLDGSMRSFSDIMLEIEVFKPDVAGITAMTIMWPKVKILSSELKKEMAFFEYYSRRGPRFYYQGIGIIRTS